MIIHNLKDQKLPFRTEIRHNVHALNSGEEAELRQFVERIREESGNSISFYSAPVTDSDAARNRGTEVERVCESKEEEIGSRRESRRFSLSGGICCCAQHRYSAAVDECGRLYRCYEEIGNIGESYGDVFTFDLSELKDHSNAGPILSYYLSEDPVLQDEECSDCPFLPQCCGGCPKCRKRGEKKCVPYRNHPETYVLQLYEDLKKRKQL